MVSARTFIPQKIDRKNFYIQVTDIHPYSQYTRGLKDQLLLTPCGYSYKGTNRTVKIF